MTKHQPIKCEKCGKEFQDYYRLVGGENAGRIWCNECIDEKWEKRESKEKRNKGFPFSRRRK